MECTTIKYPIEISSKVRTLDDQGQNISAGYTKVNVFINELDYTLITQVPRITPDALLSNIGGVLGLLVGASLISLVEIIEIAFILFAIVIENLNPRSPQVIFTK